MAEAPSWAEGRGYGILEFGVFGDLRWGLGVQEFGGFSIFRGFRMGLWLSLQVGFMLVFRFRAAHKGSGFRGVRHVSALVHICCSRPEQPKPEKTKAGIKEAASVSQALPYPQNTRKLSPGRNHQTAVKLEPLDPDPPLSTWKEGGGGT